jgi:hypothetical protein
VPPITRISLMGSIAGGLNFQTAIDFVSSARRNCIDISMFDLMGRSEINLQSLPLNIGICIPGVISPPFLIFINQPLAQYESIGTIEKIS